MADMATGTTTTDTTAQGTAGTTFAETSGDSAATTETSTGAAATAETDTETTATTDGTEALGDAGKKALDAMKIERQTARREAAAAKAERDALQAKLDGKEAEHLAAQEKAAAEAAALAKANDRILRSEVKAAAKGVLADPSDAYKFLDLDSFEVSDDGEVDETAIKAALDDLIKNKPYLAVQDGKRFQGGADAGARNDIQVPLDQQIAEATKAGDFQKAIALKQQRAAELKAKA